MAILLVISGYMLGQIPMMNNQAEQFEEMNNEIQYGFLDCILSLSYSIDNYYLQDEGLDFIDQAMGYLLNSTDANVIREHSGSTNSYSLGFTQEESLKMYDFLFHSRLLIYDALKTRENDNELYVEINSILSNVRYQLYHVDDWTPAFISGSGMDNKYDVFFELMDGAEGKAAMDAAKAYCAENYGFVDAEHLDRHLATHS